jgi:hypothetical protein
MYYYHLFFVTFISELILSSFTFSINPNVYLHISDDEPFDFNAYLLPFAIVVGICFVVMLFIVIYKCCQDHRRTMRHRLPKSALKKLPIIKFKVSERAFNSIRSKKLETGSGVQYYSP